MSLGLTDPYFKIPTPLGPFCTKYSFCFSISSTHRAYRSLEYERSVCLICQNNTCVILGKLLTFSNPHFPLKVAMCIKWNNTKPYLEQSKLSVAVVILLPLLFCLDVLLPTLLIMCSAAFSPPAHTHTHMCTLASTHFPSTLSHA